MTEILLETLLKWSSVVWQSSPFHISSAVQADGQAWEERTPGRVKTEQLQWKDILKRNYLQNCVWAHGANDPSAHKWFEFSIYRNEKSN